MKVKVKKLEDKRKSILIVEDDVRDALMTQDELTKAGYNSTYVLYRDGLPSSEFDVALVDGLNGRWREAFELVNAKRKVLFSSNDDYLNQAKLDGLPYMHKIPMLRQGSLTDTVEGASPEGRGGASDKFKR